MIERNTEAKDIAPSHKVAAALHGLTLTYGEMLTIMIELHQHSSKDDFQRVIQFEHDEIKKMIADENFMRKDESKQLIGWQG